MRTSFPLRAVKQYVRNKHDTTVAEASRGKASNQEEKSGASELRSAQPDSEANHDHNRDYDKLPCINQMGQSEINGFAADYRNLTLACALPPNRDIHHRFMDSSWRSLLHFNLLQSCFSYTVESMGVPLKAGLYSKGLYSRNLKVSDELKTLHTRLCFNTVPR